MRKTGFIIILIVGVIVLWGVSIYNGLVKQQEAMTTAWGQVENVYQRRADLVPNLVALVKNYTEYEQGTLIAVTEARAKAVRTTVNTEDFDEIEFSAFESAQNELGKSLNRLIVSVENYPDLKANEEYLTLQAQLAGCENRIQTERERFNEAAKTYNQSIRKFPSSLIAKLFGFERRPYFEADAGAERVPETF
ncbi:MAG: LemA family protein [Bacteroidales bacterium]|nr:LemA family protein [Bacteroidales bacterium]MBR6930973.1 LemA family protein [Bacteroidales bacterium]